MYNVKSDLLKTQSNRGKYPLKGGPGVIPPCPLHTRLVHNC